MREIVDADILTKGTSYQRVVTRLSIVTGIIAGILGIAGTAFALVFQGVELSDGEELSLLILALVATVVALPVHELIHGAFFKLMGPAGTKVKFGYKSGMLYATSPGTIYKRSAFLVVLLAPFVLLTCLFAVLTIALPVAWASLALWWALVFHASGCCGDLYFCWIICRTPEADTCEDTDHGIRLWSSAD